MHGNRGNLICWFVINRLFWLVKRPVIRQCSSVLRITFLFVVMITIVFTSKRLLLFGTTTGIYIDNSDCTLSSPTYLSNIENFNKSLCSQRSTRRGRGQRVIAISLFGPKENDLFQFNDTMKFLYELIDDARKVYPEWILRIYHDATITSQLVGEIQCKYMNVDFCDMSNYLLIPPKTWRFFAAGDLFVDASKSLCIFI